MKRGLLVILLVFAAAMPVVVGTVPASAMTGEEYDTKRAQANKEWLKSIPDYEMRLYERVNKIKQQVVSRSNLTLLAMLVLFIALPFWIRWVLNRAGIAVASASQGHDNSRLSDNFQRLKANQIKLAEMLAALEEQVRRTDEKLAGVSEERERLRSLIADCASVLSAVEKDISKVMSSS